MNMTGKILITAISTLIISFTANAGIVASFDMEADADGALTENVSGKKLDIIGNFTPENIPGAVGNALRFDGYTTYVHGDAGSLGDEQITTMTISMWVAPETYPVVAIDTETDEKITLAGTLNETDRNGWAICLGYKGNYSFDFYSGGVIGSVEATDLLPCYEWSHIVVVVANKRATIYRNGRKVSSAKKCNYIDNTPAVFCIGKSTADIKTGPFNINTFNGLIDDITIYDTDLSQDQLMQQPPEHEPNLTVAESRFADDPMRPAFHGMPGANWTNECHGMTYSDGRFHLFFQKNANGPFMTRLHWGHISSENLFDWQEEKIAIAPGESYDIKGCWSGCVATDPIVTGGKPNIIYTGVDYVKASIVQAEPLDESLIGWQQRFTYPIIANKPGGLSDDFRDPYFFRNGDDAYIIVGTSKDGIGATTLHKYNPKSGIWSNRGDIFFQGSSKNVDGTFWEMPNVTHIGDKWLFTATPQNTAYGVAALYWTGGINADGSFKPDNTAPSNIELPGMARDGYGLLSPTIYQHDGKTIALGIVPDKLSGYSNHQLGYAHTFSLPREWTLDSDGLLCQKPYSGLTAMRSGNGTSITDCDINGTQTIAGIEGRTIELIGEFTVNDSECGFKLLDDGLSSLKIRYKGSTNELIVDCSGLNRMINDAGIFDGIYRSNLPVTIAKGETIKLHIFFDHSILDIFINDRWATSIRVFAYGKTSEQTSVFTTGSTHIKSVCGWNLDVANSSAGIPDFTIRQDASIYANGTTLHYSDVHTPGIIHIYNMSGTKIREYSINEQSGVISTGLMGFHIVTLTSAYGTTTEKVIFR